MPCHRKKRSGNPRTSSLLLIIVLLMGVLQVPTMAHSISFADIKTIQPMTVMIYESDGDYYGTWNTSSQGIVLDPNESYYLVLKPEGVDRFTLNPVGTLQDVIDFVSANAFGFLVIIIMLGLMLVMVKK